MQSIVRVMDITTLSGNIVLFLALANPPLDFLLPKQVIEIMQPRIAGLGLLTGRDRQVHHTLINHCIL